MGIQVNFYFYLYFIGCNLSDSPLINFEDLARSVYELCLKVQNESSLDQNFFISFATFETRQNEIQRASAIYKYAIDNLPEDKIANLKNTYLNFRKQYCDSEAIDDAVILKRSTNYEKVWMRALSLLL